MNKNFVFLILLICQSFISCNAFGQMPNLGAASTFALFTAAGALSNTGGLTGITGDVGTNNGAMSGFPWNGIDGKTQWQDQVTLTAANDVKKAYSCLASMKGAAAPAIASVMGGPTWLPQVLTPNIYHFGGAATVNQVLILDGQNDPNAEFVFQINGALGSGALAQVVLINGTTPNHVFWQVNGAAAFATLTKFAGIIVANGAISFGDGAQLQGKGLSVAGAVSTYNNKVTTTNSAVAPLPVELTSFTAVAQGASARLAWNTASEKNSAYFAVERSTDGQVFTTLASMPAQGTTTQAHAYAWTDAAPSPATTVYYRLRQVDTDHTTSYSPVRRLTPTLAGNAINSLGLQAYPNPGQPGQTPQVRFEADQNGLATLRLSDALGHLLLEHTLPVLAGTNTLTLPEAATLPTGLYLIQLRLGNQTQTLRIVRQ